MRKSAYKGRNPEKGWAVVCALTFSLALLSSFPVAAQTLFTCAGSAVGKADFLKAYNKNNNGEKATERSYREYLELYIRYKLKVKAAYEQRLDTLPGQLAELQNFRSQIAETYMNDEESLDKLVNESFVRGQKDVHLAHIYIAIPKNASPADTARAWEKAMAAWTALKKGKSFAATAQAFSEDPSAAKNGGDIGYITVFTIPYEMETLAYSNAPGQFSKPYRSRAGYHIFKNLGERKAIGKMKAAQILLPVLPEASESTRIAVRARADSIYASLLKGADFAKEARLYSGDNLSYQNGGEIPEFGVGRYDSAFENAAFSLEKNGAISRPVLSHYGYHIIRRISVKPFPRQLDKETSGLLKQQVMGDPRMDVSRKAFISRIYRQAGLQRSTVPEATLWSLTDSAMLNAGLNSQAGLDTKTVLFTFTRQQYTVKGWLDYMRALKASGAGRANKTDKELFEQYIQVVAVEYYRNHLEEFNPEFAFQLAEFREGNLLFEIMQRKIWDKASTDSAGLRNYYETHKDKYWWDASVDAILFTCNNEKTAEALKSGLLKDRSAWKTLTDSVGAAVQADSGRFELAQIPVPGGSQGSAGAAQGSATNTPANTAGSTPAAKGHSPYTPGTFTTFASNQADNTVSFAFILNAYTERSPRNYRDARGFVINDYQVFLEDQWIADLKKKYPVKLDESVFASLPK
ncbi:MAG TPA: peptidylprolyl isomerase [Puia sp.]|nr:peptidylprolyl isomerase [Puia sp.]